MYKEDKIFEIIELRKHMGNVYNSFGLKRLFSCISIADKFSTLNQALTNFLYQFSLGKKYKDL